MDLREQTKAKVALQLEILKLAAAAADLRKFLEARSMPVSPSLQAGLDALERVRVEMGFGDEQ